MTDTTTAVDAAAPDAIAPEAVEPEVQAESSPAVTNADDSPEPEKKSRGVQVRIDELTRNWREAERREAALMAMLQRQQSPAKQEPVAEAKPKALPRLEDFNYDEAAYQAALFEHASAEAARKVREELKREESQRKQTERVKSWKTREAEFKAKHYDYEEVAHTAPISDAMAEIIMDMELGPELAYYLGENTAEARAISEMSPTQAARALGRLEAKLEKPATPAPQPKPVPVSKAPPPTPRIEATDSAPTPKPDSIESDKLSTAEWMRLRDKQLARKKV